MTMQIIKPDPQLIENTKIALRILETCAKAAGALLGHTTFPAVLMPEGDSVRSMKPGEVIEVPPPGADYEPCLSNAGGEACIKGKGHPGDHAGNKFVWNK